MNTYTLMWIIFFLGFCFVLEVDDAWDVFVQCIYVSKIKYPDRLKYDVIHTVSLCMFYQLADL